MKKRVIFLITIDTEEEWDWSGPLPVPPYSTENISYIHEFQDLCRSLSIIPTYFVDHAVVEKEENCATLKSYFKKKECDIGAHLHPWCNPPVTEEINDHNSFIINLPILLVERKLKKLTDIIKERFGIHPFSFRSGRWGMDGKIMRLLAHYGYQVDSSIRPFYSEKDFSYDNALLYPYYPDFENCLAQGKQRSLLEIPATAGFTLPWFQFSNKLYRILSTPKVARLHVIGILWRLKLLRKVAITPEGYTTEDICRCIDMNIHNGNSVINLFFHSSDLRPGSTAYVTTPQDKQNFFRTIENVVTYIQKTYHADFLTIREAYTKMLEENLS
ncbi:MAG: WalW protein [Deltaproteobacteria bacterium]|nr:WalW protein [Deltaproteobacteria bacterium]